MEDPTKNVIRVEMPEVMWLGENQKWLEENYPGKWVAVRGNRLIAVGDTPSDVLEQSKAAGIPNPLITGVKRKEFQGIRFVR
jgi:hypothetical protein